MQLTKSRYKKIRTATTTEKHVKQNIHKDKVVQK